MHGQLCTGVTALSPVAFSGRVARQFCAPKAMQPETHPAVVRRGAETIAPGRDRSDLTQRAKKSRDIIPARYCFHVSLGITDKTAGIFSDPFRASCRTPP